MTWASHLPGGCWPYDGCWPVVPTCPPPLPLPNPAGLLVLCRRAHCSEDELTPEWLLTLLWILESTASQYRRCLDSCVRLYLRAAMPGPRCKADVDGLKGAMVQHQLQASWLEGQGWPAEESGGHHCAVPLAPPHPPTHPVCRSCSAAAGGWC